MRPGTRGECSEGPATDGRAFDRLVGVAEVEVRGGCRGGVPVPGERHLVLSVGLTVAGEAKTPVSRFLRLSRRETPFSRNLRLSRHC